VRKKDKKGKRGRVKPRGGKRGGYQVGKGETWPLDINEGNSKGRTLRRKGTGRKAQEGT